MELLKYIDMNNNDKLAYTYKLWNLDPNKPFLCGKIEALQVSNLEVYLTITHLHTLNDNIKLKNPYDESKFIDSIICVTSQSEFANLNKDIIFRLEKPPIKDIEINEIIISCNSIVSLKTIDDIRKGNEKSVIYENIESLYPNKKVLLTSDVIDLIDKHQKEYWTLFKELKFTKSQMNIAQGLLNGLNRNFTSLNEEYHIKAQKLKKLNKTLNNYKSLGFIVEDEASSDSELKSSFIRDKGIISNIQKYLALEYSKNLDYSIDILNMLFLGLCTNQLIILCGRPGTGKTSLVEGVCEAIKANLKIISVQPNWTDNQDLLGFYNPIENFYMATPFLDTIIDAKAKPNELFIICLDEMNLSQVEYYFSEFLSKLQLKEKKLELYSEHNYKIWKSEFDFKINYISDHKEANILNNYCEAKEIIELKTKWSNLKRYQPTIIIPDNIRFIGTINIDQTTKTLSPKIIDRSFIIDLNKETNKAKSKFDNEKTGFPQFFSSSNFRVNETKVSLSGIPNLKDKINELKDNLFYLKIYLNERFDNQVNQIINSGIIKDEALLFDYIVACMMLPKINIEFDESKKSLITSLSSKLDDTKISKLIFENMYTSSQQDMFITYWR